MSNYVKCSRCGRPVSNTCGVELIVRAYIECEECIKKEEIEKKDKLCTVWCDTCLLMFTSCCPKENIKLAKNRGTKFEYGLQPSIVKCDSYKNE